MSITQEEAQRLGAALRKLRHDQGLSQERLAFTAGLTKNQVQLIEAGRGSGRRESSGPSNPRLSTLIGLADALGLTASDLLKTAGL